MRYLLFLFLSFFLTSPAFAFLTGAGGGNATSLQGTAVSSTPPGATQCLVSSADGSSWGPASCSGSSGIGGSWSTTGNVVTTGGSDTAADSTVAFTSIATLTGTQTLTNKTLSSPALNGATWGGSTATGQTASSVLSTDGSGFLTSFLTNTVTTLTGTQTLTNKTLTSPALNSATWGGTTATGQGNSKLLTTDGSGNLSSATTITGGQLPTFTGDVTNSSAAMTVAAIGGVSVGTPTGTGNVVFSASPTMTGTAGMASITVSGSIKKGNCHVEPLETDIGNSGTTQAIDLSVGNVWTTKLTGNLTATFSNPQNACPYVFVLTQDGTGSRTFTTAGVSVIWGNSGAHTLSTATGAVDKVTCVYNGDISKMMCDLGLAYQ